MNSNMLSSTFPTELGLLISVEYLDISSNFFVGSIASEVGRLVRLELLRLEENALPGSIPTELGKAMNLVHALLSGSVPGGHCSIDTMGFDCSEVLCGCDCSCLAMNAKNITRRLFLD